MRLGRIAIASVPVVGLAFLLTGQQECPVVEPTPTPTPSGCQWIDVDQCDTGGTIAEFCGKGKVAELMRCDGSSYVPDAAYLSYHLCSCDYADCGCNEHGVVWQAVQCCY